MEIGGGDKDKDKGKRETKGERQNKMVVRGGRQKQQLWRSVSSVN